MNRETFRDITEKLYELSEEACSQGEVPVACCLVTGDDEIFYSHNEVERRDDPLAHAEIILLERVLKEKETRYLRDSTLIVTLEPCLMCLGAIIKAGVRRLFYFLDDEKRGAFSHYHVFADDVLEMTRCEDERFGSLMKSFFEDLRTQR